MRRMMDQETFDTEAFEPVELTSEDQEMYDQLGLPSTSPQLFYQALAQQLARLPLIEAAHDVVAA